jgi:NADH-quinone oxidoreductase subunit J
MNELIVFWIFAPVAVGSAVAMLLQRNAVHAALLLVLNLFCISVFYLLLGAEFLFGVQIIVYAGAIMVLFLFVLMLLGVDRELSLSERLVAQRPAAFVVGAAIVLELFFAIRAGVGFSNQGPEAFAETANRGGNAEAVARVLFDDYFLPFEITSVLLIVAAIAAMVLAQRRDRARAARTPDLDAISGEDTTPGASRETVITDGVRR